ncbi:MAG: hypothetical protein LBQ54_07135 [Planctomycetaceae bacterium]|jgi:hypothetical protein|nr:hypothetical protein [Planctomycetaceae bacterium]
MPTKDGEFIAWVRAIYDQCVIHSATWKLSDALLEPFEILFLAAEAAYQKNQNPELKNRQTVANKNAAFLALKRFLSDYYLNFLESDPAIPDAALVAMGLPSREHHAHQPIPVPEETPVLTAIVGQHHDVAVYVSTLQHGHPTEYLKDGKFYGFLLKYKIEGEPEWQQAVSTRLHHTLIFGEEEEGKYVLLQAACG